MPSEESVPSVRQKSNPTESGAPTPMKPSPEGPASPGNQSIENSVLTENIQQLVDSRREFEQRKTLPGSSHGRNDALFGKHALRLRSRRLVRGVDGGQQRLVRFAGVR